MKPYPPTRGERERQREGERYRERKGRDTGRGRWRERERERERRIQVTMATGYYFPWEPSYLHEASLHVNHGFLKPNWLAACRTVDKQIVAVSMLTALRWHYRETDTKGERQSQSFITHSYSSPSQTSSSLIGSTETRWEIWLSMTCV